MKKRLLVLTLSLVFCLGLFAFASAESVQLICPSSVKVGTSLVVKATLYNYDCGQSFSVTRLMKGIGGNSGGTLGGVGLWGPYNQYFATPLTAPAATCSPTFSPGVSDERSITIMSAVPPGLVNTVAMAFVEFMTPNGEGLGGGSCMVNVVP